MNTLQLKSLTALFLVFLSSNAHAATDTWLGNTIDWFDTSNWSSGSLPDSSTDAVIDNSGANDPVLSTSGAVADTLFLGQSNSNTLLINSGGGLTTNNAFLGFSSGASGTTLITGPSAIWTNNGDFNIAYGGNATLQIFSGGVLNSVNSSMATLANSTSTVTIDGAGSQWNTSNTLYIGEGGTATLVMSDNSFISAGNSYIGFNSGSSGFAVIDNSIFSSSGSLVIGTNNGSSGTLQLLDGGIVSDLNGIIGSAAGSSGIATVDGGGTQWNNGNSLTIGNEGTGSLTLSDSAVVNVNGAGAVFVGANSFLNIGAASTDPSNAAGAFNANTVQLNQNGMIVFNQTDPLYIFNPAISGTGSVLLEGSGITVLTGVNSYSGGTTVNAGTLQGSSNSLTGSITNNSHIIFDQTFNGNFNGGITGSGDVTKNDTGTVAFNSANTYTGATNINAGVLQVAADNNLGSNTDVIFGTDPANPSSTGLLATSQSFTLLHNIVLNGNGGVEPLGNTTLSVSNISGTGNFTKSGSGTLLLTAQAAYTGDTIIQQGTLTAGVSNVFVTSPVVTIATNGEFNLGNLPQTVNNIQNNGAIAISSFQPGRTQFNTLQVDGNYSGNGKILLSTDLVHQSSDFINIAGTMTGTQQVLVADDSGGVDPPTGTVVKLVQTAAALGTFTGAIDAGTFRYEVLRGDGSLRAPDFNSFYLEQIVGDLTNTANAAIGLYSSEILSLNSDIQTLVQRMGELRLSNASGYWVRPLANQTNYNNQASRVFNLTTSGASAGSDYGLNAIRGGHVNVGMFGSYLYTTQNFRHNSNGSIQQFSLGAYTIWLHPLGWYVDAVAKYSQLWNSFYAVTSDGTGSSANYSVPAVSASLEIGRRKKFKNFFVEPQIQFETGYIAGMNYAASNGLLIDGGYLAALSGRAGARAGMHFARTQYKVVEPYVVASLIEEIVGDNKIKTNSTQFTAKLPPSVGRFGTGVTWQVAQSAYLYGEYDYAFGRGYQEPIAFSAGARWVW